MKSGALSVHTKFNGIALDWKIANSQTAAATLKILALLIIDTLTVQTLLFSFDAMCNEPYTLHHNSVKLPDARLGVKGYLRQLYT
jgi:hypothetical protein